MNIEKNIVKNFASLMLPSITLDAGLKTTANFLAYNKEAIESDCQDYQTCLFYLYYNQAYTVYENLVFEYSQTKSKLKLEILEERLTNTIDRLIDLYSIGEMEKQLLFSKRFIDLTVSNRYSERVTKTRAGMDDNNDPASNDNIIEKLTTVATITKIKDIIGNDNYNRLVNYYCGDKKTKQQRNKSQFLLNKVRIQSKELV